MRPVVLATAIVASLVLAISSAASATGAGGWTHLGHGSTATTPALNGSVLAIDTSDPMQTYVGGSFTDAGGNANADDIAVWDGANWSALGSNPIASGAVQTIAVHDGKVYVGGTFTNAGGNADADYVAVWNGSSWGTACNSTGAAVSQNVDALQIIGNTLYVGGAFQNGAGIAAADYLMACDLTTGAASAVVSTDGYITGTVYALTADSTGDLYAGGAFVNMDHITIADHIAMMDTGGNWHAMGSGPASCGCAIPDDVRSLASDGTNVYVGADSDNIAGLAKADRVAKWDGSNWNAMGSANGGTDGWFPHAQPTSTTIYSLATAGSLVFAGGTFTNANGDDTADYVAYFDGSNWHPVSAPMAPVTGHG